MKRIFVLFMIFNIFLISSCSPRVTYTKEFPYLPAYKNMTLETAEGDAEEEDTQAAGEPIKRTYIVQNVPAENVLAEYEEILNEDGWTTTLDGKPQMIEVKKDEHEAMIIVYEQDDAVKMDITAK